MVPDDTIANWLQYGIDEGKDYMFLVEQFDIYPVYVSKEHKQQQLGWYMENGALVEVFDLQAFREVSLV